MDIPKEEIFHIGEYIKKRIIEEKFSQTRIGKSLGKSPQNFSKYLSNNDCRIHEVHAIGKTMRIDLLAEINNLLQKP